MKSCPLPILLSALFGLTLAAFAGAQDKVVTAHAGCARQQGVPGHHGQLSRLPHEYVGVSQCRGAYSIR